MEFIVKNLYRKLARSKKWLIVGSVSLLLIGSLVIAGFGVLVYKAFSVTQAPNREVSNRESVSPGSSHLETTAQQAAEKQHGLFGTILIGVAGRWIEEGLAAGNLRVVKDGLYCIDALGGPNPDQLLNYLKRRALDQGMLAQLSHLKESLGPEPSSGNQACTNWILNS